MQLEDWLTEEYGHDKGARDVWMQRVSDWRSWFIGYNKSFHDYYIWNGKNKINLKRKSLQMAKKCCEDWANILYNVNCTVSVKNQQDNERLQEVLAKNDFWLLINQAVEKSFAVGTGALVQSVIDLAYDDNTQSVRATEGTRIALEYVDVDNIYPLSWDAKSVTECAFVSARTIKGIKYAIVSVHLLDGDSYLIKNRAFIVTQTGDIQTMAAEDEAEMLGAFAEFRTGSLDKWFCVISPALSNNLLTPAETGYDYPFGISIYANAIDAIKCVDMAYDAIANEITIGRMRIFASADMMDDVDGKRVFDSSDISVYELPKGLNAEQLLQPVAPALRIDGMQSALNADLSIFSNLVGMGRQMYDFSVANMATAAQVYSTNSELKRSRDKHKTRLENELFDFVSAICYACSTFTQAPINPEGLTLGFDDALFEDVTTTSQRLMHEKDAGLISGWEYRMETRHEDEITAKAAIAAIEQEMMQRMVQLQEVQGGEI